jgi:hypothetical protein
MTPRHRRGWIACLIGAALAASGALALAGFGVLATVHRVLEIFTGDRGGDPVPVQGLVAAALALLAALLLAGAAALAIAGRRAARTLERASLIEHSA